MSNLINISETFCRTEAYDAAVLNCYAFRRGTDLRNGIVLSLGNMVSGYPFEIEGFHFHNSECAYQRHRGVERAKQHWQDTHALPKMYYDTLMKYNDARVSKAYTELEALRAKVKIEIDLLREQSES